jgi:ParB-like chromosome segregation protein Spo0J
VNVAAELQDHLRPVDELVMLPGNPRQGDVGAISESLDRFGQLKPIVVNADGVILAGNHTFQAAVALGWSHVAAITVDLEGSEATGFALADNRLSDLASYDNDALLAMILETGDLRGTGYDADDVDSLKYLIDEPLDLDQLYAEVGDVTEDDHLPRIVLRVEAETQRAWYQHRNQFGSDDSALLALLG